MNSRFLCFLLILLLAISLTGCSGRPDAEIAAVKSAVDVATSEGAEKYAPEDAKRIYDALTAAQQEIKTEEEKLFRNYTNAREMLLRVKTDAEKLRASLPARKEGLRKQSLAALEGAASAFTGARAIFSQVSKGRLQEDLVDTFENDLLVLEADLSEARQLDTHEDYNAAVKKADAVKNKAVALTEQIRQSFEKSAHKAKKTGSV